ncbi:MAG: PAS domain S-box protein [Acidobacteria bacterium]|nr:PAS domain S-box protein [Acidobacteriota bacterium]
MNLKNPKLLIISENPVSDFLESINPENLEFVFTYDVCSSLTDGIEKICSTPYDLVLHINNHSFDPDFSSIGEITSTAPEIPLIIVSDLEDQKITSEALRQGAQDCLVHGQFDIRLLNRAIWYAIERKKTERDREVQKAFFQQLFEKSPLAIVIVDNKDKVVAINHGFTQMFQFKQDEIRGLKINDLIVPKYLKEEATSLSADSLQGSIVYADTIRKRKDGWLVDVSVLGSPIKLQNEKLGVYGMYTDITTRKKTERALQKSEEKFRRFVEGSFDIIYEINNHGRITYAAPNIERITGYSSYEILGKPISDFLFEEQFSGKRMRDILKNFLSGKSLVGFESRVMNKSGDISYVEINATPIYEDGKVIGSQGIIRDITRRKATEKLLLTKTMELEAANQELESFSYSVSHDLRAPIRHIAGFITLMKKNLGDDIDKKIMRYINLIAESAKKMGDLIDDLLGFSRMSRAEMTKIEFDPGILIKELIDEMKPECENRNIHWKVSPLIKIYGDPVLMRQVFFNLLSNAIKYTSTRQRAVIEIKNIDSDPDNNIISIKDNGVGFDEKYADKLFGVFQRLHDKDEFEGTGIGLAIVKRIIIRHGGEVRAESKINSGSNFFISLPKKK